LGAEKTRSDFDRCPCLPLWQHRAGARLSDGPDAIVAELMQCMKYRLLREEGLPIGSGAVESAHRHVLQTRMKRAGQRWSLRNARRIARLRAAYRTAGALGFYYAIRGEVHSSRSATAGSSREALHAG
jgi:hypothetical protein